MDGVQAPKNTTRYSIPFFMGIRMDLTLSNLRDSARHIVEKVPVGQCSDEDEMKRRAEDVPSEFLSDRFDCVCSPSIIIATISLCRGIG